SALQGASDYAKAEASARRALRLADSAGDDRVRVLAILRLLRIVQAGEVHYESIPLLRDEANAAIARLGGDEALEAKLLGETAGALVAAANYEDAAVALERAIPMLEKVDGPRSRSVAHATYILGRTQLFRGDYVKAEATIRTALAIAVE